MSILEFIVNQTRARKSGKNQYIGYCPVHGDRDGSLVIQTGNDDQIQLHCRSGCRLDDITKALSLSSADHASKAQSSQQHPPSEKLTVDEFAKANRVPAEFLSDLGVKEHSRGVEVPYFLMDGSEAMCQRLYSFADGKEQCDWLNEEAEPVPYGLWKLKENSSSNDLIIVEGELNCWTLWWNDFTALGLPGAEFADTLELQHVEGCSRVFIHQAPNEIGEGFAKQVGVRLLQLGWPGESYCFGLGVYHDPNALSCLSPNDFSEFMQEGMNSAKLFEEQQPATSHFCCGDRIQSESIEWLWPKRFPLGKLSLLIGDPGLGKSILACYLVATVSRGGSWPDDTKCPSGSSLLLSLEDGASDTILPRLNGFNANVSKIYLYQSDECDLANLVPEIESQLNHMPGCRLLVIDPVTTFLGERDANNHGEMRRLLTLLSQLAKKRGIAVVAISHMNKNDKSKAIYRTLGSLSFSTITRTIWLLEKHPHNPAQRVLFPLKNNLTAQDNSLCFAVQGSTRDSSIPEIIWPSLPYPISEQELFSRRPEELSATKLSEAQRWLQQQLEAGTLPAKEIKRQAEADGFRWRTIERAKKTLNIDTQFNGDNDKWEWKLVKR